MRDYVSSKGKIFVTAPKEVKIETHLRLQELKPQSEAPAAVRKWDQLDRLDLKFIKEHSAGQDIAEDYTSLDWVENLQVTCAGWLGTYTGTAETVVKETKQEGRPEKKETIVRPKGVGRFIYEHGGWIYEGQFKAGRLHGFVRVIYFDGSYFCGKMKKNQWVKTQYHN